jgi:hypothetical protein
MFAPRQGNVTNHIECCRQHLADQFGTACACLKPFAGPLRRGRHGGSQSHDIAVGEDRSHRLALPFPIGAFGIEQAVADRGPQHPLHDLGFRIVGQFVQHDLFHARRIGQHVPAHQHFPRNNRLAIGQSGNEFENIAPGRQRRFQATQPAPVDWRSDGHKWFSHGTLWDMSGGSTVSARFRSFWQSVRKRFPALTSEISLTMMKASLQSPRKV